MINHVRTLLANVPASSGPALPGEEWIDPQFSPLDLRRDPAQQALQVVLFGQQPDRWMVNWRVHQLLVAISLSRLEGDLELLDPRLSLRLPSPDLLSFFDWVSPDGLPSSPVRVEKHRLSGTGELEWIDEPERNRYLADDSGRLHTSVLAELSGGEVVFRYLPRRELEVREGLVLDDSGQFYRPVPLRQAGLLLRFSAQQPQQWYLRIWRLPMRTVRELWGEVLRIDSLLVRQIFEEGALPGELAEHQRFYRRVWESADDMLDRFAALLLGAVLSRHRMWLGQG